MAEINDTNLTHGRSAAAGVLEPECRSWLYQGKTGGALFLGLLILIFVAIAALLTLQKFAGAAEMRLQSNLLIGDIQAIESQVKDAETGQRGYLLTSDHTFRRPYDRAVEKIPGLYSELINLTADNPRQRERAVRIKQSIDGKMADLQATIRIHETQGLSAAQSAIQAGPSMDMMNQVRALADEMKREATEELNKEDRAVRSWLRYCATIVIAGMLLAIGHVVAALIALSRDVSRRAQYQEALAAAQRQMERQLTELNSRNREITRLSEMADQLQACTSLDEAFAVISGHGSAIFPSTAGTVYIYTESRDAVEASASWNGGTSGHMVFDPQDCWALRRGQLYQSGPDYPTVPCKHLTGETAKGSVCIPMLAQGQIIGLLHLQGDTAATREENELILVLGTAVAEHVALAFANLRLRETLRQQSIRDPLTGLFNRRYMEESLEREVRRAERTGSPLGVVMLDLDHFKKLNDTYGHEAGDAMLRAVAKALQTQTRGEDVVCRYGGEELAIILPEGSLEDTAQRAQSFCDSIRALQVRHLKDKLTVTASMGVAAWPDHGESGELLIRMADRALYQAKEQGRDRIVIAEHSRSSDLSLTTDATGGRDLTGAAEVTEV